MVKPFGAKPSIQFMSKNWDKAVPSVAIWKECLRVLKHGSFAFIMCLPRQDVLSRMIVNLEDAGFNTNFTSMYHCFASGFPKALNLSKAADKRGCTEQLTTELGRKPTKAEFDEAWGTFREVVGLKKDISHIERGDGNIDKQSRKTDGNPFETTDNSLNVITAPTTDQAKALDGWYGGFNPKPATEIILVAQKPMKYKSYTDNALAWCEGEEIAIGGTNFDACRIPCEPLKTGAGSGKIGNSYRWTETDRKGGKWGNNQGRFPANVLVSNNALDDGQNHSSGGIGKRHYDTPQESLGFRKKGDMVGNFYNDSGSFSRYFSLDAWFSQKIKELPPAVQQTFPCLIVPKSSISERTCQGQVDNKHSTVKPIALMSYLITLGSSQGDIVLDPFAGSGTTGLAAKMLNRRYLLIEIDEEYYKIAKERLESERTLFENIANESENRAC